MAATALFICPRCGVQKRNEIPLAQFLCPDEHRLVGVDFPNDTRWCYCAQCGFFFYAGDPVEPSVIGRVPDCCPSRREQQRYVQGVHCAACGVLSLFVERAEMGLALLCPGCGKEMGPRFFRHTCEWIPQEMEYLTFRPSCPFCGEAFRPSEAAPAPVAQTSKAATAAPAVAKPAAPTAPALKSAASAAPVLQRSPPAPAPSQSPASPSPKPAAPPVAPPKPAQKPGRPTLSEYTERAARERGVHRLVYMTFIWFFFPFLFTYEVAKAAFGRRGLWKVLLFALFLAGLASGVYWAVKVAYLDAFPRRFRNAVADGRLTRPLGDNAVEIYRYEKTRHPESPDLAPAAAVIKERVLPKGERAFEALNGGEEKGTDWAEVETIYDFLSTEYPGEADHAARLSFAKGQRAFRLGKDEEALANYKAALTQEPRWALALDAIGKVYAREGSALRDESLALRYFDEAGRADPTFPWGYRDTAEYFASKGNNAAAELYLRKAVAADAQQPSNLRRLGDVCLQSMKQGEARRFYEKSLWYETDPEEAERTREKIRAIKGAPPAPAPMKTP